MTRKPELVNEDAEGAGWIYKISSTSPPNSIPFWIGKLISLTCWSKVEVPLVQTEEALCDLTLFQGLLSPITNFLTTQAKRRKLSELQGQHPMVLVLSRGGFCPKDRRQAEGLFELHREMEVGYCRLVTISTDNITETNEYRSGVGAHWPFLSDTRRTVQKDLDIADHADPTHNPMIPHVIVLEPGLVIYKIYNGYWFFGRPTLEDLRQDLRALTKKCRPDWDITTPELKEAWQQGRKELFLSLRQNLRPNNR